MPNLYSDYDPSGHLEITKIYSNGKKEVVYDDKNYITSGLGVGLTYMFTGSGASQIPDFQIGYFQVGANFIIDETDASQWGTSAFQLSAPISAVADYGTDTQLIVESLTWLGARLVAKDSGIFAQIPFTHVTKVTDDSVRYTLILDEESANGLGDPLREVGLFMRNPTGAASNRPILVAYRHYSAIQKTNDFSLVYNWTLSL